MNAAISIPNPIFEAAKQVAQRLGMSLNEFCTAALAAYVAEHQIIDVTDKLNQVYETESSSIDPVLLEIQVASLDGEIIEDYPTDKPFQAV